MQMTLLHARVIWNTTGCVTQKITIHDGSDHVGFATLYIIIHDTAPFETASSIIINQRWRKLLPTMM